MSIYAVNGKEPVAAWIPSLDDAGNGTTTLTDLVGTLTGTLTNMDAATDWVANSDAGGVRALDFDGVNNDVRTPAQLLGAANVISISLWMKPPSGASAARRGLFSTRFNGLAGSFAIEWGNGSGGSNRVAVTTPGVFNLETANNAITLGQWQHVVFVRNGASQAVYVNAVSVSLLVNNPVTFADNTSIKNIGSGLPTVGGHLGLLDDLRVFNQALALADVQYLYSGGFGRGVTASGGTIIPILRQHYAAQGAR